LECTASRFFFGTPLCTLPPRHSCPKRRSWAKTYLKQAGLVEQPKRGFVQISGAGRAVLARNPERIDNALLQAKRYQPGNTIGSETVQAFIGALIGKGAQKGVLITTSSFSRQALVAAGQSGAFRLVLIDGTELTRLMVRFNVGVRVARTVEIKRIDLDYFDETETE